MIPVSPRRNKRLPAATLGIHSLGLGSFAPRTALALGVTQAHTQEVVVEKNEGTKALFALIQGLFV